MYKLISKSEFCDAFVAADRQENFSREARELLYDHFEECAEEFGDGIGPEMDVIAACVEYSEDSADTLRASYAEMEEFNEDEIEGYLEDNTMFVGRTATGFVYLAF